MIPMQACTHLNDVRRGKYLLKMHLEGIEKLDVLHGPLWTTFRTPVTYILGHICVFLGL
jgi:hypothetical protein